MRNRQTDKNYTQGRLPASAYLANLYVPFQSDQPAKYEAQKAIIKGTLYPGLDLPFMGMVNKKPLPPNPMTQMQTLAFAIQELALYLDTHRNDQEALDLYKQYQHMYNRSQEEYVKKHGPICHNNLSHSGQYEWLNDPWPWEYAKNKEG